jgi:transposase InsO family protein
MGIRDQPIAPGSPWQNGFAERLIGSIRRECVDVWLSWAKRTYAGFRRKYSTYHNQLRTLGLSTKTLRSIAPSSTWAASYLRPSSADFITTIAESEFRYRQPLSHLIQPSMKRLFQRPRRVTGPMADVCVES